MKVFRYLGLLFMTLLMASCGNVTTDLVYDDPDTKIVFLHHSTGKHVWYGDIDQYARFQFGDKMCMVPRLIKAYNEDQGRKISIEERAFPSGDPYAWKNYPYDYYNIWVKNAGEESYMGEPTLEILTKEYDMIIFKFCFPYSNVFAEDGNPDINSEKKTIANYKLQYDALKEKMHEFPDTKFLVWTGAALVEASTTLDNAQRAKEVNSWVIDEWNEPGDNIELFDFREIETEGGLYLLDKYAANRSDSHPNLKLSESAAKSFVQVILDFL